MVSSTLQRTVVGLSPQERVELRDFIYLTLGSPAPDLTDEQKAIVKRRSADMAADSTLGVPWEDAYSELMAKHQ